MSKYGVFSGPYFAAFRIQENTDQKNFVFGIQSTIFFHAVRTIKTIICFFPITILKFSKELYNSTIKCYTTRKAVGFKSQLNCSDITQDNIKIRNVNYC